MTGVVVVGDVINDVIVRPAGPTATDTDTEAEITSVPGGSGANQATWLAALGVSVRLVARVGAADAEAHRQLLAASGVDPRLSVDPDLPTGSIVVLVGDDGTRSMFTDRGANTRFGVADLNPDVLDGMTHLHLSGYALVEPASRAAVVTLWHAAGQLGLTRSVDAGSAAYLRGLRSWFLESTAGADVIFANRAEARIIAGSDSGTEPDEQPGDDDWDPGRHEPDSGDEPGDNPGDKPGDNETLARLLRHYPVVALKLGPEGAVVATTAATVACPPATGMVIDPTGAGDAFCAAFLARWLDGPPLADACASAAQAAATALARVGGRPPEDPSLAAAPPWEQLRRAAHLATANAYAPYSGLRVGAAGITDDGRILTGCNVENASFGLSLCAECGLVSALRAAGGERLLAVSVVGHGGGALSPCGRCRQVMLDNGGPGLLIDRGTEADPITLGELLPEAFGLDELSRHTAP